MSFAFTNSPSFMKLIIVTRLFRIPSGKACTVNHKAGAIRALRHQVSFSMSNNKTPPRNTRDLLAEQPGSRKRIFLGRRKFGLHRHSKR